MLPGFIFICACHLRICYILLSRLAVITRTAPFQTSTGCGPGQTATTRRQSLWLHRAPGDGEILTFSLGYRFWGLPILFRTSWGHRGPTWVHLWVKVTSAGKNQGLSHPDQPEEDREHLSPFFREINIWNFSFTWLILSSIVGREPTRRLSYNRLYYLLRLIQP